MVQGFFFSENSCQAVISFSVLNKSCDPSVYSQNLRGHVDHLSDQNSNKCGALRIAQNTYTSIQSENQGQFALVEVNASNLHHPKFASGPVTFLHLVIHCL